MSEYFIQDNLNQDDYDNDFYYLTENKDEVNEVNNDELNDNIYQEDFQHGNQHIYSPSSPTKPTQPTVPVKPITTPTPSSSSNYLQKKWLYIFLLILVIALVAYFLIDKKYIKLPSFESKSTFSPSSSTLGSTFMSLH